VSKYLPPPAFHTFDPIARSPDDLFSAISESFEGRHAELVSLAGGIKGLPDLVEGEAPKMDAATILLICILDWQEGGGAPRPLDNGHSRERLGRFPSDDGDAVSYLLEYTKEKGGEVGLHGLLKKLGGGMTGEMIPAIGFERGSGGIELMGWLDQEDIPLLREFIESGSWKVLSDEPYDGGVQDAFRHLLVFLRAAGRRKCGLLMRRHS
jgi:hypothetical protein|tara:strand:- start:21462 stop:22088 length:627 start_codon:yes stop_codon:yes gene_type:complete